LLSSLEILGGTGLVGKRKAERVKERINHATTILGGVSEDSTTPHNIRRTAKKSMEILQSQKHTFGVRAANAISILEEILEDRNMPSYTRVKLLNVIAILETVRD